MTTKRDISKNIAEDINISINESNKFIDTFLELIKSNIEKKLVKISGFGTFFIYKTPKRLGRNPKTKESYIIPPMNKINFKSSNKVKRTLNWLRNFYIASFF